MFDAGTGTIYLFLIFTLLGIGPACMLSTSRRLFVFAIAPVCGLCITSIVSTYLVFFNLPVNLWAKSWLIGGTSLSLSLAYFQWKSTKNPLSFQDINSLFWWGLLIISLLLVLPMVVGGLSFTLFRGNATDTFNYLSLARLLSNQPYHWVQQAPAELLASLDPTYPWAQELLKTRWSTSVLLAWCSHITQIPLYRLEHGFTVLFFIMVYSTGFNLAHLLSFKPWQALFIASSISLGFWAQLVLDIRAMSHISVLPITLFLCLLMIETYYTKNRHIIIGLCYTLIALVLLYVEIMPLIIMSLFFFIFLQYSNKEASIKRLAILYGTALGLATLLIMPILKNYLWHFFINQLQSAQHDKNNWEIAYFHWLYARPLFTFWGNALWAYEFMAHQKVFLILKNSISLLGLLLFSSLFGGLFYIIIKKTSAELKMLAAFLLTALLQFLYLVIHHQWWAAGKALTYVYPFFIMIIASMSWIILPRAQAPAIIFKTSQYLLMLFLLLQCGLAGLRVTYACQHRAYKHYILHHYDYLRHDWDLTTLQIFLKKHQVQQVGVLMKDPFLVDYIDFTIGQDRHVIHLASIKNNAPRYVIVAYGPLKPQPYVPAAKTREFALIDMKSLQDGNT